MPRTNTARNEPPRVRSSTTRSGSSGCATLSSSQANTASSSTPLIMEPRATGSVQLVDSTCANP